MSVWSHLLDSPHGKFWPLIQGSQYDLWLFITQNHSFQHFNSTWPACPALAGEGNPCQRTISRVWGRSLPAGSEQFLWSCLIPYCVLVHSIVDQSDKAFMQVGISKKSFWGNNSPFSCSLFSYLPLSSYLFGPDVSTILKGHSRTRQLNPPKLTCY